MIIQRKHFDALAISHYAHFENYVTSWLERHFPEDCALLGANATRSRIRDAVQVGARCGFIGQRDAARFVYLWFLFGPHFDLRPEYATLQRILLKRDTDATTNMDEAFEYAAGHVEHGAMETAS